MKTKAESSIQVPLWMLEMHMNGEILKREGENVWVGDTRMEAAVEAMEKGEAIQVMGGDFKRPKVLGLCRLVDDHYEVTPE